MAYVSGPTAIVTPLETLIRDHIRDHGPMPVSEYMALALAHPDDGYYRKTDPLGHDGDFVTAPEISQTFGEIIGLWCAVTWQRAGQPDPFGLVELGPGRGTLMADALRAAAAVPGFAAAANIHLIETSPILRDRQRANLRPYDVTWHETLDTVPLSPCLYIANEFFDALPIDQFVRTAEGWVQRCVGLDPATGRLVFVTVPGQRASPDMVPAALTEAPAGSVFERCPLGLEIAATLGDRLMSEGIAALVVDYGYTAPATGETLQAVRGHGYHDVLTDPGEADLTAHVDFSALAGAARSSGALSFGPVSQRAFFSALGIETRTEMLAAGQDAKQANLLRTGTHRLIDSQGMGTLFKVIALTNGRCGIPAGFEASDGSRSNSESAHL